MNVSDGDLRLKHLEEQLSESQFRERRYHARAQNQRQELNAYREALASIQGIAALALARSTAPFEEEDE